MATSSRYTLGDVFPECLQRNPVAQSDTMRATPRFQMFAHRSIYLDGWRAVCPFSCGFEEIGHGSGHVFLTDEQLRNLDASGWELYNLLEDPEETRDLAHVQRGRLLEMIALWYATSTRHYA